MDSMDAIREQGIKDDQSSEEHHGELCRFLAKICIQIINGELKDPQQRSWYFALPSDLKDFARIALEKKYPWSYVKDIVLKHIEQNLRFNPPITYAQLHQLFPCQILSDNNVLESICDKVLASQEKAVQDYKKGKTASLNRLKGLVMKETAGKADIQLVEQILIKKMS